MDDAANILVLPVRDALLSCEESVKRLYPVLRRIVGLRDSALAPQSFGKGTVGMGTAQQMAIKVSWTMTRLSGIQFLTSW